MKSLEEVEQIVKQRLSEKRFKHSQSVKEKCIELAKIYGEDVEKAALVGIAHDIAKELSIEEKFKYCEENNLFVDEVEKENPELLHAKIGADIAKKELGFSETMVKAIQYHTTGKVGMDRFAKIVFVADSISVAFFQSSYDQDLPSNEVLLFIQAYELSLGSHSLSSHSI